MTRRQRLVALFALAALALGLVPVFQSNLLAPGDSYYFSNWDKRSQSLVLGKIAQDVSDRGTTPFGLAAADPDPMSSYETFDGLQAGVEPTSTRFYPYASSLGLQGHAFEGLYNLGCTTVNCLTAAESTMFAFVFVLFSTLLALALRRSIGIVALFCGLLSPWVVSAAHNLYWVPWTWILPACFGALATMCTERRWRVLAILATGIATGIKSATGYEYLTATTLLAASIPILAFLLGRRKVLRDALALAAMLFAACAIGFIVVLVIHLFVAGAGSFASGLNFVMNDALRRTLGSADLDPDPLVNSSLKASVFSVLVRYAFGWSTALFAVGVGGPYPSLSIGPAGFWVLTLIATSVVAVDLLRKKVGARRSALILLVAAAPPLSWLILGKSHSFAETNETYALWYWILIPMMVWSVLDRIWRSRVLRVLRALPIANEHTPSFERVLR